jgi:sensor c-di-GMP phosphodiesterase-like protein
MLGPPRYVSALGVQIRPTEHLSIAPGQTRIVAVRGHSAVVVAPELITDLFPSLKSMAIGVFSTSTGVPVGKRGTFDPRWRTRLGTATRAAFVDGPRIVALERSRRFDLTAYVALPAGYGRAFTLMGRLLPLALLVGFASCFGVFWLARQQRAFPAMLLSALRNDEFFLAYQPIVDLATGRWVGAETLIRWQRPDGAEVRPDVFIPVAEDNGLIARISSHVLKLLAHDAPTILALRPDFRFSVNLSQDDLMTPMTVHQLRGLLATGLTPANLTIEATERGVMEKEAATQVLREIRALGMRVAIDDFGTGYANLAYLHSFEVDAIKIDKSFVDTIGTEAVTAHVALLIIQMGKTLSLDLVAEGIEHAHQADYLRDNGVHYGQGWLFARPMRADELRAALAVRAKSADAGAGVSRSAPGMA